MLAYYKKVVKVMWKDFRSSVAEQLIGALLGIAILVFQIHFGVIKPEDERGNFWSICWPYVLLISGFLVCHLVRAPWKIHHDQETQINCLQEEVAKFAENQADLSHTPTIAPESYGRHPSRFGWGLYIVNDSYAAYDVHPQNVEVGENCKLIFIGGKEARLSDKDGKRFFEAWLEYSDGRTSMDGSALRTEMVHGHTTIDIPILYKDGKLNLWRSICRISLEPEKGNGLGVSLISQELLSPARLMRWSASDLPELSTKGNPHSSQKRA
jgi:hypothetical protein